MTQKSSNINYKTKDVSPPRTSLKLSRKPKTLKKKTKIFSFKSQLSPNTKILGRSSIRIPLESNKINTNIVTYDIIVNDDKMEIKVNISPFLPQVGLFLTNETKTYIIIDIETNVLVAVLFDPERLLNKEGNKESIEKYEVTKVKCIDSNKCIKIEDKSFKANESIVLTFDEIRELFSKNKVINRFYLTDNYYVNNTNKNIKNNNFNVSNIYIQ